MAFEPIPTALIHQLRSSLRQDSSLSTPSTDLPSLPSMIASIEDAAASLDASLLPASRCRRCRGGLLCGRDSDFCIYCGKESNEEEGAPREISFAKTVAYNWLLGSLGLDGSDAITFNSELSEPTKTRGQPKTGTVLLSDVLDLKLSLSPNKTANHNQTGIENEPNSTSYTLNLSGIDLDSIFKETKKEIPSNKIKPVVKTQIFANTQPNIKNLVKAESSHSFAKWDADFEPNLVNNNETESSFDNGAQNGLLDPKITTKPGLENTLPMNHSEPSDLAENLNINDDNFDDWNNFEGSVVGVNKSDDNLEALNAEFEKDLTGSQNGLTDPEEKIAPVKEVLNVSNTDNSFDDWNDFSTSNSNSNSNAIQNDPLAVMNIIPSDNSEKININGHDLFDDWNDFSGSGMDRNGLTGQKIEPVALNSEALNAEFDDLKDSENGLTGLVEKIEPVNLVNSEAFNAEFDDWKHSNVSQNGLTGQDEKNEPENPDALNAEFDFDDWKDSQTGLTGQDKKNEPENLDALNAEFDFDDWKDSQNGLTGQDEKNEPENPEALNAEFDFDDWKDSQTGLTGQDEKTEPLNSNPELALNAEFDDWENLTVPNIAQSGLSDPFENIEPVKPVLHIKSISTEINESIDLNSEWLGLQTANELVERATKKKHDFLNITYNWSDITNKDENNLENNNNLENDNSLENEIEEKNEEDLFDDWQDFTGSSEVKKEESISKQGDLNSNLNSWENNFSTGSSQVKGNSTGTNDGSYDWLDFTSADQVSSLTNIDSLNGGIEMNNGADPLAVLMDSKLPPKPVNDVEKFTSQMNDISFMLKDELSIPKNK